MLPQNIRICLYAGEIDSSLSVRLHTHTCLSNTKYFAPCPYSLPAHRLICSNCKYLSHKLAEYFTFFGRVCQYILSISHNMADWPILIQRNRKIKHLGQTSLLWTRPDQSYLGSADRSIPCVSSLRQP